MKFLDITAVVICRYAAMFVSDLLIRKYNIGVDKVFNFDILCRIYYKGL